MGTDRETAKENPAACGTKVKLSGPVRASKETPSLDAWALQWACDTGGKVAALCGRTGTGRLCREAENHNG